MNQKTLIALGVGCAIIACLAVIAVLVVGGLWIANAVGAPEDIRVTTSAPASARVGESVEIVVTIANDSDQSREINSIDIYNSYLEGIIIQGTQPGYIEASDYGSFSSYYFLRSLAANEAISITFIGEAVKTGDFSGDLDVCIDSETNCTTNTLRIIIRE